MDGDAGTFRLDCGAVSPLRLCCGPIGQPPQQIQTFELPFALVGRHPDNNLVLGHQAVSRRHAYLQLIRGQVFCLDLKSHFGMQLAGARRPFGWLTRTPLIIWPFAVSCTAASAGSGDIPPEPPNPLSRRTTASDRLPEVVLDVRNGSVGRGRWVMTRELALAGRRSDCKVHLVHPSVSAYHCSLVRTPGGLWVVDLLSRTGVLVNGTRVRWARLADGDQVAIGQFRIDVRLGAGSLPKSPATAPASRTERELAVRTATAEPVSRLPAAEPTAPPPPLLPLPVPTDLAELERRLGGTEGASLLMGVLQQVQAMQQQMYDHYQQSLLSLVQVFARLHGDQMSAIRQELDQLRSLTEELQSLQAQLAAAAREPARPAPPETKRDPAPAGKAEAERAQPARPAPAGGAAVPPADRPADGPQLHAWLNRRIDDLQRERQGRLRRMLSFVLGQ
jgi:pSer/pThr/pTyr-binding forkhead associated (FHA) protein